MDHDLRLVTSTPLRWDAGLEYVLSAVALLVARGRTPHLDVVGAGPERDRVVYTIFDLDITDRVTIIDPATPAVGRPIDTFLWLPLLEQPSRAAACAAAIGIDVITTVPGLAGTPVTRRDPSAIADALMARGGAATAVDEALAGAMSEEGVCVSSS